MHPRPGIVLALLLAGIAARATAQPGSHTHAFTPLPESTVAGIVQSVDYGPQGPCEACFACDRCQGAHLVLRKGGERVEVHLAPAWYLDRCGYELEPGEVVAVTGTRIALGRGHGVLAREVRRGDEVMKFRDEHGLPLWRRELTEP